MKHFNCHIINLNAQGFLHNKDEIELLIHTWRPLIICLTETHVTKDVELAEVTIDGYRSEICYTDSAHTGGVIFYIKNEVLYQVLNNFTADRNMWCLVVKIQIKMKDYILIGVYHSPSASCAEFLSCFETVVEEYGSNSTDTIILGDFNINMSIDTFYSKQLENILIENGLEQLIKEPTRITKTTATTIDLLITNNDNISFNVNHIPRITDHAYITISLQTSDIEIDNTKQQWRNFKNYDERTFQNKLLDTEWDNNIIDTNRLAENLINNIATCLDEVCPVKEIIVPTKYADKKWITEDILQAIKERDNRYEAARITNSEEDWNIYREKRNKVTSTIRQQKQNYYEQKIDECKNSPKTMWKTLKQICKGKRQNTAQHIKFNDEDIYNELEIAEKFNAYFIDSISDIIQNIPKYNIYEIPENETQNRFEQFNKIEMSHLRKIISSLPNKIGSDGISTKIIKTSFEVIGNRFLDVINNSLQTGIFPKKWKSSLVTPIPKVTNTVLCEQHRPINSLPVGEKILEMTVKEQLISHCQKNNIIIPVQSGFREGHSCETALQCIMEDWVKAIDVGNIIVAVFLDFKRAFETIDRGLLLLKLQEIGICGTVHRWFSSYLNDRRQRTKFGVSVSSEKETEYGVPQGSVLGPVLFTIFINDIVRSTTNCKVHLFADDTMLYIEGKNVDDIIRTMNDELNNLYMWLCDNNLKVNIDKCKWMILGKKDKLNKIVYMNSITINNQTIEKVSEMKYLGVILDENISLKQNVNYIVKKVAKKVNFLRRLSKNISMFARLTIYKTIIAPHFEYCSSLLLYLNNNEMQILQKMQNKAMRVILQCNRYTPINSMLQILNFMTVRQRVLLKTLQLIYKIKNGMVPSYLYEKITYVRDIHSHNTRRTNDLHVDRHHSLLASKSLFCKGLKEYNNLPNEIKNVNQSLKHFTNSCVKYIKTLPMST